MSAFTDRLYRQWRDRAGDGGFYIPTGRPALPTGASRPQKAKTPGIAGPGSSVRNPIKKGSNHGIRKV